MGSSGSRSVQAELHLAVLLSVSASSSILLIALSYYSIFIHFWKRLYCWWWWSVIPGRRKVKEEIGSVAGFCSVVECSRRAGCLLGEAGMELGQEAVGWQQWRPQAGLFGLDCGRCWRGVSWCWWQNGEVWRRAPLPAAAWGTRWTAMAWGSTPYPKTSPEGLRGCE